MADRRLRYLAVVAVLAAALVAVAVQSGLIYAVVPPSPDGYERATVTVADENGTQLATVEVRIADTRDKRYLGLSATEDLPMGEGMLFVHDSEASRSYVMRDMSFPLDIVYVGADQRITEIHHAAVPDGEYERRYTGRAKWVLEVPRGWINETGVAVGDRAAIPPAARDVGDES